MLYYLSIRIDEPLGDLIEQYRKSINLFLDKGKVHEIIWCRETYSPKLQKEVKPHYHIGIATTITKSSIGQRLIKIMPELKRKREEAKVYNIKEYDTSDLDIRRFRQYHSKGKGIGEYEIIRTTHNDIEIGEFNAQYWKDRSDYKETLQLQKHKRSLEELFIFMEDNRDKFIFNETVTQSDYDFIESCKVSPLMEERCVLDCDKMFDLIVEFYKGGIQMNILELRYNQLLFKYSKSTLLNDLKSRFNLYRSLPKIILSHKDIDVLSKESI